MEAFVYIWNDNVTGKMYIGSHKGTKDDGYICSSKYMLEEYQTRPQHFSRVVVAEGSWQNMRNIEAKLLQKVNAAQNEMFYNKHNCDGKFYNDGSHNIGRKRPDLSLFNTLTKKGKKDSSETKLKKSITHKNMPLPSSFFNQMGDHTKINRKKECFVCGKITNLGNLSRWHNNNCRSTKDASK